MVTAGAAGVAAVAIVEVATVAAAAAAAMARCRYALRVAAGARSTGQIAMEAEEAGVMTLETSSVDRRRAM